jgi:hypothetical protein
LNISIALILDLQSIIQQTLTICLSVIVIWQHYNLRRLGAEISDCPTKYWWLGGLGGALVAAIAIGSAIKTETGWGWTWRGRPLQIKS